MIWRERVPYGRLAQGSGSRFQYTLLDVLRLKIVFFLRQPFLSLQKIRRAVFSLLGLADESAPLVKSEVVAVGHRILDMRSDEQRLDLLARQYVLRLSLVDLLAEIGKQAGSGSEDRANQGVEAIGLVGVLR